MHQSLNDPRSAVLSPVIVGAALDCLAALADIDPVRPSHMHLIARAHGCREPEASALTLRLLATAALFNDPRWPAWLRFYKTAVADRRRGFDAVLVFLIVDMALDAHCRFPADHFFDVLLNTFAPTRPT